jgi:aminocarboxymuconate-semialdehyde decarboxylase
MLTIDIHTHILPAHIPDYAARFGYGSFVTMEHYCPGCARMMVNGKVFREVEENTWSAEARLHECDTAHVHYQVLSTVPVMFCYWAKAADALDVARYLNDHLADVVRRHPNRFMGLGTVPLQDPQLAITELERCMQLGLRGVQIGSNVNGQNLSDPHFFAFFEACQHLGAAVFVHPWDMMGEAQTKQYWLPWLVGMPAETTRAICSLIFGGVFERLPKLRVAFAHGGGSFPYTLGRIEHGWLVRPDLVAVDNAPNPRTYLGRFWLDSLVHDPYMLRFLVGLVGPDKVALGTDYPFPLGEWWPNTQTAVPPGWQPGHLIRSIPEFTPALQQKLMGTNALDWLGFAPSEKQAIIAAAHPFD